MMEPDTVPSLEEENSDLKDRMEAMASLVLTNNRSMSVKLDRVLDGIQAMKRTMEEAQRKICQLEAENAALRQRLGGTR